MSSKDEKQNRGRNTVPLILVFFLLALFAAFVNIHLDVSSFWAQEETGDDRPGVLSQIHLRGAASSSSSSPSPVASQATPIQRILIDRATSDVQHPTPIPVYIWQTKNVKRKNTTAAILHLINDGVSQSPYLKWINEHGNDFDANFPLLSPTNTTNPPFVMVTEARMPLKFDVYCEDLLQELRRIRKVHNGTAASWPIYIVYHQDSHQVRTCPSVENYMGHDMVMYSSRSIAVRRTWAKRLNWVDFGTKKNLTLTRDDPIHGTVSTTVQHIPIVARTDTVETLQNVLKHHYNLSLADNVESGTNRSVDVAHFWPLDGKTDVNTVSSNLRTLVSNIVYDLGRAHSLTTFVGLSGKATAMGRSAVVSDYIETLVKSKIVVVTQRNGWEDHYRLHEALVSGACVLTDFMHGLPSGLVNGTSIVIYSSAAELQSQILYYLGHETERLAIAREGRRVTMSRHRSWHHMEEIIFGRVLSTCSDENKGCPWSVHA